MVICAQGFIKKMISGTAAMGNVSGVDCYPVSAVPAVSAFCSPNVPFFLFGMCHMKDETIDGGWIIDGPNIISINS